MNYLLLILTRHDTIDHLVSVHRIYCFRNVPATARRRRTGFRATIDIGYTAAVGTIAVSITTRC